MPVLILRCPDCGHEYRSLLAEGSRMPTTWSCSRCGNRRVAPVGTDEHDAHPFSGGETCACCG